jgi:hypothetical protein
VTLGGSAAGTLSLSPDDLAQIAALDLLRVGGAGMVTGITVAGPVTVAGGAAALELLTTGAVTGSAGPLVVRLVSVVAQGDVTLDHPGNRFAVGSITTGAGRNVTLRDPPDLVLTGPINAPGGTVTLRAEDRILQEAGAVITTGILKLEAPGQVALNEANDFATLGASTVGGGSLRGLGFTIAGPVTSGGALTLAADGGLALTGQVSSGGALSLNAGGAMTLAGSALAQGNLAVQAGGPLILRGRLGAETARLAAPSIMLDGARATIGRAILFRAPGGIGAGVASTVAPRDPGLLPAVVFDTRGGSPADALGIVQPDLPGVLHTQQPTQVRQPNSQAPGAFGLASGAAAGAAVLALDAGAGPVFLLLDGGTASGSINAGRLGIHGVGGTVGLVGSLSGAVDSAAAIYADITRPIDATAIASYRINGCVVAGINCTPPPVVQFLPVRPVPAVELAFAGNRIDTSEVTIPNVGEDEE